MTETPVGSALRLSPNLKRLGDHAHSETLSDGAIREIAQRLAERRGEGESIEALRELVRDTRQDGEVTEEEKAQLRERVSTELAQRGRDGSNIDPERQERREQLRERIAERRAVSGAFVRIAQR